MIPLAMNPIGHESHWRLASVAFEAILCRGDLHWRQCRSYAFTLFKFP